MSIIAVTTTLYIDIEHRDPEEVCLTLSAGLERALATFPDGDVIDADVEGARTLTPEEISERGYEE